MHRLCIRNIGRLATMNAAACGDSDDPSGLGIVENAAIATNDDLISWIGPDEESPSAEVVIDAGGALVCPGLIDCHTHLVFGGERSGEFARRCRGESYEAIAAAGGGILSTVAATREASEQALYDAARARLDRMLALGVTTVEAKSGYGLDLESELTLLRVMARLNATHAVDVIPTFLGAHSVPAEFKGRRRDYIALLIDTLLPAVCREHLAEFCDIFCERGVFEIDETREILRAARSHDLKLKLHAEQLHQFGGTDVGVELGAVSVDHLEQISDAQIARLAASDTVAVLLPGSTLFLGSHHYAPARRMLDAGVTVALATDLNPGSAMTEHLPLMTTLAAVYMGMTPAESLKAITINAAKALDRGGRLGQIRVGLTADLLVTDLRHEQQLPYRMAIPFATHVIKAGQLVWSRSDSD